MLRYVLNILIAIDQLINTLIGGYPDEILSESAWLGEREGKLYGRIFRPVIDFLFLPLERSHCKRAFEAEFNFSQRPRQ
jgi:hypothetical protein